MPYGVPNYIFDMMTVEDQTHARRRVENAQQGDGRYGSVENAKAANLAQWGGAGSSSIVQPHPAGEVGAWAPGGQFYDQPMEAAPEPSPYGTDGGYGSDGGYGAGALPGPPPRPKLAESPEWLAYLNALGLEQSQFEADIARQRGILSSEAGRQTGALGPQYQRQRRDITAGLQDRGMLRSGERLRRDAESRSVEGQQKAGIQAGLTGQLSGLESQLAQKMIDIGARKADRELSLRSAGYQ